MDTLQKLIVIFFGLTIVTAIGGLGMFYVEKPYISKSDCSKDRTVSLPNNQTIFGATGCTYTVAKDASPLMETIINSCVVFGIVFLALSLYAYCNRRPPQATSVPAQ